MVGASRLAVAAPLLLIASRRRLQVKDLVFIPAGLCIAAYQLLYFSAVPRSGVAATALLAICSAPVFVAVLARILQREPMTPAKVLALALGAAGGILLGSGANRPNAGFAAGLGLALGAGLAYSLYLLATKRGTAAQDPRALAALTFGAAALALLPVLAVDHGETASLWSHAWPLLLYLGAVPTALAYWLFTAGLKHVAASSAAIVGLLEPLTATLLALTLFSERLSALGWLGAALLLAAVVALSAGLRRAEHPAHGPHDVRDAVARYS